MSNPPESCAAADSTERRPKSDGEHAIGSRTVVLAFAFAAATVTSGGVIGLIGMMRDQFTLAWLETGPNSARLSRVLGGLS